MAEELIDVGQYLTNVLNKNKDFLMKRYNKEQIAAIQDFTKIISEECTASSFFMKQLVFINLSPEEKQPEQEESQVIPEPIQEEPEEESEQFSDMFVK